MKNPGILLAAFVLLSTLLTACGCSGSVTTEGPTQSTTTQSTATQSTTQSTEGSSTGEDRQGPAPRIQDRLRPME